MRHPQRNDDFFDYYTSVDVPGLTAILNRVAPWDERVAQVDVRVSVGQPNGYELSARTSPEKVQAVRELIDTAHILEFLETFNPDVCRQILEKLASTDAKLTSSKEEIKGLTEQLRAASIKTTGKRSELRVLLGWLKTKGERAKVAAEAAERLESILEGMA